MHRFAAIFCLVAVTHAGSLGYKYGVGSGSSSGGLSGSSGFGGSLGSGSYSSGSYGGGSFGGSLGGGSFGGSLGGGNSFGSSGLSGVGGSFGSFGSVGDSFGSGGAGFGSSGGSFGSSGGSFGSGGGSFGSGSVSYGTSAPVVELTKEFLYYSAPETEFHDHHSYENIATNLKKNIRVIFIKAPENNALSEAALHLTKKINEDKTAIYVLTKQSDVSGLANQFQTIYQSNSYKPEVHFIKYKTHDDITRAQQSIQAQYEKLGGSSHSSDEGVAEVLDYASKGHSGSVGGGGSSSVQIVGGGVTDYSGLSGGLSSEYITPTSSSLGVTLGGGSSTTTLAYKHPTPSTKYLPVKKIK